MKRGFACGVFDLFHPGHVLMLAECRLHCDHLTVAVNKATAFDLQINPGKRSPVYTAHERAQILNAMRDVSEVLFYDSEAELAALMENGNYHIRFLGDDYRDRLITAPLAIPAIHYLDRSHGYSTTAMLERITKYYGNAS